MIYYYPIIPPHVRTSQLVTEHYLFENIFWDNFGTLAMKFIARKMKHGNVRETRPTPMARKNTQERLPIIVMGAQLRLESVVNMGRNMQL